MSAEQTAENDGPVCEYGDCRRDGWTVLHFGPKMTPPRRIACHTHLRETDLGKFRDDASTRVFPPAATEAKR